MRIGEALCAYDSLIANNDRRIALLKESIHLLYREWFERRRFPGHEWTRVVDDAPAGWRHCAIRDIAELERYSVVPDQSPSEEFAHFSFPAFDAGRLPAFDRGDSIKSMKYLVTEGTVLVPKLNPHIPRVWTPFPDGSRRAIASSEYLVLRPKPPVTRAFLTAFFDRPAFLGVMSGRADGTSTSHKRVKPADFMAQPCLIPDATTLERFDERVAPMVALRQTLLQQNAKLRETRDYLLPRLMSGRLAA